MDKSQSFHFSPIDSFHWFENRFFDYLKEIKKYPPNEWETFTKIYRSTFDSNLKKVKFLINNELDKGNVYLTLLVVSAYEALLDSSVPREEAIILTDECLNKPTRKLITEGTKQMLDHSPNPFQTLVEASKERELHYFGDGFEFERPIDDEYGYVLHIKKCLFHLTLKELNRQELQHLLCRIDLGWINGIDSDRHNLQFVRPVTFATGNKCQMWFMKKEKEFIKDILEESNL